MTDITITANGKKDYHYHTTATLTEQEISKHIEAETFPEMNVVYEVKVTVTE